MRRVLQDGRRSSLKFRHFRLAKIRTGVDPGAALTAPGGWSCGATRRPMSVRVTSGLGRGQNTPERLDVLKETIADFAACVRPISARKGAVGCTAEEILLSPAENVEGTRARCPIGNIRQGSGQPLGSPA